MGNRRVTRRVFWRLLVWGIVGTMLSAGHLLGQGVEKKTSSPNILMIMVDDLGYGDLSSYGAKDLRTPHIDALVRAGMRFDNFYASCPVCSPTRAALLSGCTPDMVGVPGVIRTHQANSWGYLKENIELLPAVLKKAGYHTAIVGKWHLGLESPNTPTEWGFDLFRGFLGDMMDDYWHHRRHDINYMYSLEDDPQEQNPLPSTHKMHRALFKALQDHINRSGAVPWARDPVDITKIYQGM